MRQNYRSKVDHILSQLPPLTEENIKNMEFQLGIDEAGRDAVIGPMVFSAVWIPVRYLNILNEFFWGDAKKLKEDTRFFLYEALEMLNNKVFFFISDIVTPEFISNRMLSECNKMNLNMIVQQAIISLINKVINKGVKIRQICLSPLADAKKYEENILKYINSTDTKVIMIPKADLTFKVISAASIVAKVTREKTLIHWQYPEEIVPKGHPGSGGPSDQKTIEWMKANRDEIFGYPNILRFSWATYQNNAATKIQSKKKAFWLGENVLNQRFGVIPNGKSIFQ